MTAKELTLFLLHKLYPHHHIYYSDSDRIDDYFDNELSDLLKTYFERKEIPDVTIEDIKLQIIGKSKKPVKNK